MQIHTLLTYLITRVVVSWLVLCSLLKKNGCLLTYSTLNSCANKRVNLLCTWASIQTRCCNCHWSNTAGDRRTNVSYNNDRRRTDADAPVAYSSLRGGQAGRAEQGCEAGELPLIIARIVLSHTHTHIQRRAIHGLVLRNIITFRTLRDRYRICVIWYRSTHRGEAPHEDAPDHVHVAVFISHTSPTSRSRRYLNTSTVLPQSAHLRRTTYGMDYT